MGPPKKSKKDKFGSDKFGKFLQLPIVEFALISFHHELKVKNVELKMKPTLS